MGWLPKTIFLWAYPTVSGGGGVRGRHHENTRMFRSLANDGQWQGSQHRWRGCGHRPRFSGEFYFYPGRGAQRQKKLMYLKLTSNFRPFAKFHFFPEKFSDVGVGG